MGGQWGGGSSTTTRTWLHWADSTYSHARPKNIGDNQLLGAVRAQNKSCEMIPQTWRPSPDWPVTTLKTGRQCFSRSCSRVQLDSFPVANCTEVMDGCVPLDEGKTTASASRNFCDCHAMHLVPQYERLPEKSWPVQRGPQHSMSFIKEGCTRRTVLQEMFFDTNSCTRTPLQHRENTNTNMCAFLIVTHLKYYCREWSDSNRTTSDTRTGARLQSGTPILWSPKRDSSDGEGQHQGTEN